MPDTVQGDQEEIRKAQKMLDEVNAAFSEAESKKEEATAALRSAKQREEELKAAKVVLEAALAELKVRSCWNHPQMERHTRTTLTRAIASNLRLRRTPTTTRRRT